MEEPSACLNGMAYDKAVADRIWKMLVRRKGLTERKMFGGIAFMINGNMCCGVIGDRVVLRLGSTAADEALEEPHVEPMDFTGKPMRSMVYLEPAGYADEAVLRQWVRRAAKFASMLPPK